METLIRNHIMTYFLENNLIRNKQYGFISGCSTMLQLLHMLDDWAECLEKGGHIIDAVYTDFEKAFDKVPHRRLISKLQSYKINHVLIEWIVDFLKARKFGVKVNGGYSRWQNVTSVIPQGLCWVHIVCASTSSTSTSMSVQITESGREVQAS